MRWVEALFLALLCIVGSTAIVSLVGMYVWDVDFGIQVFLTLFTPDDLQGLAGRLILLGLVTFGIWWNERETNDE